MKANLNWCINTSIINWSRGRKIRSIQHRILEVVVILPLKRYQFTILYFDNAISEYVPSTVSKSFNFESKVVFSILHIFPIEGFWIMVSLSFPI